MSHYDALIVGARPAGAATAMLLARAGAKVLVVDRAEAGTDTMSTHSLTRGGVMLLARWGLFGRLRAAETPAIRSATLHYADEAIELTFRTEGGIDGLIAPRRTVLDPVIAEAAREPAPKFATGRLAATSCAIATAASRAPSSPTSTAAPARSGRASS